MTCVAVTEHVYISSSVRSSPISIPLVNSFIVELNDCLFCSGAPLRKPADHYWPPFVRHIYGQTARLTLQNTFVIQYSATVLEQQDTLSNCAGPSVPQGGYMVCNEMCSGGKGERECETR